MWWISKSEWRLKKTYDDSQKNPFCIGCGVLFADDIEFEPYSRIQTMKKRLRSSKYVENNSQGL